jgi:hypothetical protein
MSLLLPGIKLRNFQPTLDVFLCRRDTYLHPGLMSAILLGVAALCKHITWKTVIPAQKL